MNDDTDDMVSVTTKPAWLAPVLIVTAVVALYLIGKRKSEATENVVVDYTIIAVAVAALWAVFRKIAQSLDAPGMFTFFGGPVQPHPDHASTVDA